MCLLAIFFRVLDDTPLVVGANREEAYTRLGTVPQILPGKVRSVGGVDPVAGGTWLGVNERGLLVAVTNRRKTSLPPQPPSRGLLARELLQCPDAISAAEVAHERLARGEYAGCNLLLVDRDHARVVAAGDRLEVRTLMPGLHVLTAGDVDDTSDRRLAYARRWLSERDCRDTAGAIASLKELCGQTGDPPMCIRGKDSGTVSSSIIALSAPPRAAIYLHAQGPPDVTPYEGYSELAAAIGLGASRAAN